MFVRLFLTSRVVAGYAEIGEKINSAGARQLLFSFEDGNGMLSFEDLREITNYKGVC
jgi:Ca2+-binding EF-hand superfamily protein